MTEISRKQQKNLKYRKDNSEYLIPGATDCQLLEVLEGTEVTAFFKDLTKDPYSDQPELLVEGMWSVTFVVEPTVLEEIRMNGDPIMSYPFLDTTAKLEKFSLTPLGMTITADISEADEKILITSTYQFQTPISIAQVSGVYLEDQYLSFKE